MSFTNERGQYGPRPIEAEQRQYGHLEYGRGQYGPIRAGFGRSFAWHLALHVAGIMLVGLGLAYLLIRWSGA